MLFDDKIELDNEIMGEKSIDELSVSSDDEELNESNSENNIVNENSQNIIGEKDEEEIIPEKENEKEESSTVSEESEISEDDDEDYISEEDVAKSDGVFTEEGGVDQRAKKAYVSDAVLSDLVSFKSSDENLDEEVEEAKSKKKNVQIVDDRFSAFDDVGFTESFQNKKGWRTTESQISREIGDSRPKYDEDHKILSAIKIPAWFAWNFFFKWVLSPVYFPAKWIANAVRSNDEDNKGLIGKEVKYSEEDSGKTSLKGDMKANKVTAKTIMEALRDEVMVKFGTDDCLTELLSGKTQEEFYKSLMARRNELVAHVLGKGNPFGAYKCFLDSAAAKKGIFRLDEQKVAALLDGVSDEKLKAYAEKVVGDVKATQLAERISGLKATLDKAVADKETQKAKLQEETERVNTAETARDEAKRKVDELTAQIENAKNIFLENRKEKIEDYIAKVGEELKKVSLEVDKYNAEHKKEEGFVAKQVKNEDSPSFKLLSEEEKNAFVDYKRLSVELKTETANYKSAQNRYENFVYYRNQAESKLNGIQKKVDTCSAELTAYENGTKETESKRKWEEEKRKEQEKESKGFFFEQKIEVKEAGNEYLNKDVPLSQKIEEPNLQNQLQKDLQPDKKK